ncbi:MAG: hypothetical protein GY761_10550 [Hyphomicrobiales bacterium]|nr:hypothetical protein [Hyphomicrobiales bacterium]
MFTQTHLLLNSAILTKRHAFSRNCSVVAGALFPDSDVWLMFLVERAKNTPGCEIFHYRYLQEPWISLQAAFNSFLVYVTLFAVGYLFSRTTALRPLSRTGLLNTRASDGLIRAGVLMMLFSGSALLHISIDFLLHNEDARRQFWPVSNWIFRSPLSYWDPNYFGNYFAVFEILLGVSLTIILWRRFPVLKLRIILVLICLAYAAPIYTSIFGAANHDRGQGSCEKRIKTNQLGS